MEKWKEVFGGIIPKAVYQVQLINGEKQGLTIKLKNGYQRFYQSDIEIV